ncbi:50S ribosomal protein L13 [Striga asiatica]|uniref:50S ribosomal protein L13 n=1 Tax=Striga asiatica TaxID=4170 RepID=A0A5A7QJ75_STRAF|nr:50S ribosomal protein L13 [Striga asiatica]
MEVVDELQGLQRVMLPRELQALGQGLRQRVGDDVEEEIKTGIALQRKVGEKLSTFSGGLRSSTCRQESERRPRRLYKIDGSSWFNNKISGVGEMDEEETKTLVSSFSTNSFSTRRRDEEW